MKKSIVRFLIWALFKAFFRVFWFLQGRASFPKTQQKNSAQNGGCFWTLKSEKCKKTQKKLFFYFIVPNRPKYHTDHLYTYKGYILTVSFTEKCKKLQIDKLCKKQPKISEIVSSQCSVATTPSYFSTFFYQFLAQCVISVGVGFVSFLIKAVFM